MKKFLLTTLCCLLFLSLTSSALANGWGLRGGVYDIVSEDDRFDGYTTPSSAADDGNDQEQDGLHTNHAILQNRYHAVLIAACREDGRWTAETISTTAVYQPGDPRGEYPYIPTLWHTGGGFVLKYGDNGVSERYTFVRTEAGYRLYDARYVRDDSGWYTNSYIQHEGGMQFWQSGPENTFLPIGDALWRTDGIMLEEFNIEQMPRTMAELRSLNTTSTALLTDAAELTVTHTLSGEKSSRMLPVYSAPDASSFRSAEGKASVSTGGEMQIFGEVDGWTLIQYEVSGRTSRIGYVEGVLENAQPLAFAQTALITTADTILTDDPFVSQYEQAYLPAGTELTGLAKCGEFYAYAEYTLEGQLIRGFVPLKDLTTKYDRALTTGEDQLMADVRWDVMDALVGKWRIDAGGSLMTDLCILFSDGGYRSTLVGDGMDFEAEGSFRVYDGEDGKYLLYFRTEDNQETRLDLTLNVDGTITVSSEDGEGTYRRDEYSTYGNG